MSNPEIKVYVTVSTENGTHQCSRKYHDGNVGNIESTLGQFNVLSVEVEKKLFLHQKGQCRMRPYYDMFNENFFKLVQPHVGKRRFDASSQNNHNAFSSVHTLV